jgi:hypothetical protein
MRGSFLDDDYVPCSQRANRSAENSRARSASREREQRRKEAAVFGGEAVEVVPTWAPEEPSRVGYREIDRQLRSLASQKARLDVEEARWLREAERQRVWRELGYSTALEYLEEVFGYAPRTAMDKLRVANELGLLPELEAAVRDGELPWSAAKELTRVMTPETQAAWLARARGKTVGDIQRLVAGRRKGDEPDAPPDPELMTRRLVVELPPRVDALLERMRHMFQTERGEHVDDAALIEALCMRAIEVPGAANANGKAPRPVHRIVTYRCEDCARAWREGRGRLVEVTTADLERAACDAELVGAPAPAEWSDEPATERVSRGVNEHGRERAGDGANQPGRECAGDGANEPSSQRAGEVANEPSSQRAGEVASDGARRSAVRPKRRPPPTLTIPKATRDFVWARDQGRCRVPGCRATRNLECHHVVFQSQGGDHDPANLLVLCDGHHTLLHDGLLVITGRAPDQLTFTRNGRALVDAGASSELEHGRRLRDDSEPGPSHAMARHGRREPMRRRRFDDVVKLEYAKQALMQLGFKARAAKAAAEAACAHVGSDADIPTIVKAALQRQHPPAAGAVSTAATLASEAKQALRQLGYPAGVAGAAVARAVADVGLAVDLATVIKEALRRCGTS